MAARAQPLTHGRVPPRPFDDAAAAAARRRRSQRLTPPGALGVLEDLAAWLAGVTGSAVPEVRARVVVAAADQGVAARDGSARSPEDTAKTAAACLAGGAVVRVLAREAGADVVVVDAGLRTPVDGVPRVGLGPSNDSGEEPALSVGAVAAAVDFGRSLAERAAADGITVLVGGELGIAGTTPAACLTAWLCELSPDAVVGQGSGLDADALRRRTDAVAGALARHGPQIRGPLGALRRLGGGDIAVLCGLALGAGEHGLGYVCDGVVATAAAAVAAAVEPDLRPRLLASHRSPEPAHGALLDHLGLRPVLDLGMRLGDGSGAICALPLLRLAATAHTGMVP